MEDETIVNEIRGVFRIDFIRLFLDFESLWVLN